MSVVRVKLYTKNRITSGFTAPTFFGTKLSLSEHAKILGLYLDKGLTFIYHWKFAIQKATASFWQCRRAFVKDWGLSPKVLHWIYTAIIRPRLSYAVLVWWQRCRLAIDQLQLSKLQRLALDGITGAMKSTPTAALEAMLNIEPLHTFLEASARTAFLRLKHSSFLIDQNLGHCRLWKQMTSKSPELEMPCDLINPVYSFEKSFKVNIPDRNFWSTNHTITITIKQGLVIYDVSMTFSLTLTVGCCFPIYK